MPRQARQKSESGIYHIMLRGINRQQIFEDDDDCQEFLCALKAAKAISGFQLFAYCLMGNHVHLLLKTGAEPLEQLMKRLAGRYVYWFNVKYQRSGHLFQDRFRSEPVEDDAYFLATLRYIHQNPVKAGLAASVSDYKYSSYCAFLAEPDFIDRDFVFQLLPQKDFAEFHRREETAVCLELEDIPRLRLTEEQAKRAILQLAHCRSTADFQKIAPAAQKLYLKQFKDAGLSLRQISRLTGTSLGIVRHPVGT